MNCFNFNNKQSFMDYVQSLSDGDIILQRKLMSNLLDDLKSKYHDVKLNIELTVIPTLKAINRKRNISIGNEYFKQALEDFFHMYLCDLEYLKSLKNYSNSVAMILNIVGKILSKLLRIHIIKSLLKMEVVYTISVFLYLICLLIKVLLLCIYFIMFLY